MFYAKRIVLFLCFCIGILIFNGCINNKSESKKMFEAKDKVSLRQGFGPQAGRQVVLEWIKTDMLSPEYTAAMGSVWQIALEGYTTIEMQFLKSHPEVVGSEDFFKPFEPFFKNGLKNVDWKLAEEKMQEILKGFFVFDTSTFSDEMKNKLAQVEHIFIVAKDKQTGEKLGFITFLITPEYLKGDVRRTALAILPKYQNRGLGKLLTSAILKIMPQSKRILACTRVTNENAKRAYKNWGFALQADPVTEEHGYTFNKDHWVFMEYKIDEVDILQKTADSLICVK